MTQFDLYLARAEHDADFYPAEHRQYVDELERRQEVQRRAQNVLDLADELENSIWN